MNARRWLERASAHTVRFDELSAQLAAHQAAEPAYVRTDAASLQTAMQLKAENLELQLRHVRETQRLVGELLEMQRSMLRHLSRAPRAIAEQAEAIVGAN